MSRCLIVLSFLIASNARAFCGFYVAKGDAKIFNRASKSSSCAMPIARS